MKNKLLSSKLNKIILLVIIILLGYFAKREFSVPAADNGVNDTSAQILGNKDDLVSFSISPNTKVHGVLSYSGVVKGGYFFEANILVNVLDVNKKLLKQGHATAKDDWMTIGPVSFEGNIDFSGLPVGSAYIEIHNDNASGLPANDKSILIPIVIE